MFFPDLMNSLWHSLHLVKSNFGFSNSSFSLGYLLTPFAMIIPYKSCSSSVQLYSNFFDWNYFPFKGSLMTLNLLSIGFQTSLPNLNWSLMDHSQYWKCRLIINLGSSSLLYSLDQNWEQQALLSWKIRLNNFGTYKERNCWLICCYLFAYYSYQNHYRKSQEFPIILILNSSITLPLFLMNFSDCSYKFYPFFGFLREYFR